MHNELESDPARLLESFSYDKSVCGANLCKAKQVNIGSIEFLWAKVSECSALATAPLCKIIAKNGIRQVGMPG